MAERPADQPEPRLAAPHEERQPEHRGGQDEKRHEPERVGELPPVGVRGDLAQLLGLVAALVFLRVENVVDEQQRGRDHQRGSRRATVQANFGHRDRCHDSNSSRLPGCRRCLTTSSGAEDCATWIRVPCDFEGRRNASFQSGSSSLLVDQLHAEALEMLDRGVDVVGLEGHVVHALSALLEEPRQEALAERLQQLDLAAAGKAQLHPAPRVRDVTAHQVFAAEAVAVELQGRLDRVHGDGDMVELELQRSRRSSWERRASRPASPPRRTRLRSRRRVRMYG